MQLIAATLELEWVLSGEHPRRLGPLPGLQWLQNALLGGTLLGNSLRREYLRAMRTVPENGASPGEAQAAAEEARAEDVRGAAAVGPGDVQLSLAASTAIPPAPGGA